METLKITDEIEIGKNKSVKVSDIVKKKGQIFKLIKKGFLFDDEVLEAAHITKIVRDEKVINVCADHKEDKKTYAKDKENAKNIIKSLNILDGNDYFTEENTEEDNVEMMVDYENE